jgi:guanylate kinase
MSVDFTSFENRPPLLLVLSGPSGVGKDATVIKMKESNFPVHVVVTATTRQKRPNEIDGRDYHFLSKDDFQHMITEQQLLEWAKVYDNYYGIPKSEIKNALDKGIDAIIKVDVQGSATIKRILPEAVLIFLMPPSLDALKHRLLQRHGTYSSDIDLRLNTARREIAQINMFDYVVTSSDNNLELIVSKIQAIITAEKSRINPRIVKL